MKKLYTLISFMVLTAFCYADNNPGFFQIRLTKPGSLPNTMHVQMRAVSSVVPTTSKICYDLGFKLHWTNNSITSVDIIKATSLGGVLDEQPATGSSGNWTQSIGFCSTGCGAFNFPANWILNQWVNIGTVNILPAGSATDFTILPFDGVQYPNINVDFFDDYTPANAPLPLNLLSFKADKSGTKDALISWVTTNEENTSHFVVERSFDKKTWSAVGSVGAAGYSLGIEQYSFTDIGVYNGRDSHLTAYYRLQMVDQDASTKTSPIESVVFGTVVKATRDFIVYPNPSSDGIQVEWDANRVDQPTTLEFFDIQGKLVYSQKVSENTDQEYIDFGHTTIVPGLYMLRILSGEIPLDYKQIVVAQR
ncbi:MAG: T9SS type A sorting domain-containing protein [Saprospiraceae bacterium]